MDQVKQFILDQGWTPQEKPRRKGKLYLYAARRKAEESNRIEWRYIAPVSKVESLTEDRILAILAK
ncbi:MAG TPA: hypothetical protein VHV10_02460 [Ktedonobacteraceae bacterium]|jgi:hypothetical protein|nr:hypothetical protein [Ktedonobacteraceae bacterium]